jgi:hypothetical protein
VIVEGGGPPGREASGRRRHAPSLATRAHDGSFCLWLSRLVAVVEVGGPAPETMPRAPTDEARRMAPDVALALARRIVRRVGSVGAPPSVTNDVNLGVSALMK